MIHAARLCCWSLAIAEMLHALTSGSWERALFTLSVALIIDVLDSCQRLLRKIDANTDPYARRG